MARNSDTHGSDKCPPLAVGQVRLAVEDAGAAGRWP
jgi:hypothetical protein